MDIIFYFVFFFNTAFEYIIQRSIMRMQGSEGSILLSNLQRR